MRQRARLAGVTALVMGLVFAGALGCTGSSCGGGGGGNGGGGGDAAKGAPVDEYANIDKVTAGTITGKVMFTGSKPTAEKLKLDADKACVSANSGEDLFQEHEVLNDDGSLRNVMVYIKSGLGKVEFPVPNEPVVLDQQGCRYNPHVFGVRAGQEIEILNSDSTLHNINAKPKVNRVFNKAMPKKGMKSRATFKKAETGIYIKCDAHPWMNAWCSVFEHPYFNVSGDSGRYELKNVPPGKYVVAAYHEKWGNQEQEVTVEAKGSATADFSFDGKESFLRHKTLAK